MPVLISDPLPLLFVTRFVYAFSLSTGSWRRVVATPFLPLGGTSNGYDGMTVRQTSLFGVSVCLSERHECQRSVTRLACHCARRREPFLCWQQGENGPCVGTCAHWCIPPWVCASSANGLILTRTGTHARGDRQPICYHIKLGVTLTSW